MNSLFGSKKVRVSIAAALAALATTQVSSTAQAREYMLMLVDRSGSMTSPSTGTPLLPSRWDVAKALAVADTEVIAADRKYALWSFNGSGIVSHIPFAADATSSEVQSYIDGGGLGSPASSTPLAGAICDAVDELIPHQLAADDVLILKLYSDGLENSTPMAHPCWGPSDANHANPTNPLSWESLVMNKVRTGNPASPASPEHPLIFNADFLFEHEISIYAGPQTAAGGKQGSPLVASIRREGVPVPPSILNAPGQEVAQFSEFLRVLADSTGGRYRAFSSRSRLPVVGDVTGDYCVDMADLKAVRANMGARVGPYSPLDPNQNGYVDGYDERTVQKHLGKCRQ